MDKIHNRLKVVLAEEEKTSKWLSEQLGVTQATVSKWCTNASQPPMETFVKIARLLNIQIDDLIKSEK